MPRKTILVSIESVANLENLEKVIEGIENAFQIVAYIRFVSDILVSQVRTFVVLNGDGVVEDLELDDKVLKFQFDDLASAGLTEQVDPINPWEYKLKASEYFTREEFTNIIPDKIIKADNDNFLFHKHRNGWFSCSLKTKTTSWFW